MKENVKNPVYKREWFWLIIVIIVIAIIVGIKYYNDKKEEEKWEAFAEGMTSYYEGIEDAEGYLDDFSYNYITEEVEYNPKTITLEMFNRIQKGMTEEEVIEILGIGEKITTDELSTYIINWEKSNSMVQICFDKEDNKVIYANQVGLK